MTLPRSLPASTLINMNGTWYLATRHGLPNGQSQWMSPGGAVICDEGDEWASASLNEMRLHIVVNTKTGMHLGSVDFAHAASVTLSDGTVIKDQDRAPATASELHKGGPVPGTVLGFTMRGGQVRPGVSLAVDKDVAPSITIKVDDQVTERMMRATIETQRVRIGHLLAANNRMEQRARDATARATKAEADLQTAYGCMIDAANDVQKLTAQFMELQAVADKRSALIDDLQGVMQQRLAALNDRVLDAEKGSSRSIIERNDLQEELQRTREELGGQIKALETERDDLRIEMQNSRDMLRDMIKRLEMDNAVLERQRDALQAKADSNAKWKEDEIKTLMAAGEKAGKLSLEIAGLEQQVSNLTAELSDAITARDDANAALDQERATARAATALATEINATHRQTVEALLIATEAMLAVTGNPATGNTVKQMLADAARSMGAACGVTEDDMREWIKVSDTPPPADKVVETMVMDADGITLTREQDLYLHSEGGWVQPPQGGRAGHYVPWAPTHWRTKLPPQRMPQGGPAPLTTR